ncbi:MAG: hypothetical protein JWR84_1604 [Caulobacter sp.]|nr:hypothetical protein [Caulobacter sp.]
MNATPSLSETLRGRLAEGQPVDAVLDGWALLDSTLLHDPAAFAEALGEAAKLDTTAGFAAIAPEGSLGAAVISPSGALAQADPQFIKWFGDPTDIPAFRRLVRLAQKQGQASGLVETEDGGVIAACAAIETLALRWPLSDASRAQLLLPGRRVALLGFAPSRVSDLAQRAAQAFGFTPLEARLAEALLDAPNLNEAAERIGVGRETAREALKKAMRKAGARRSPDLVRRMMDLMSGMGAPIGDVEAVLRALFGATPAEAKAAARFAEGMTAREVAAALGVKEATVRGQLKAVFAKTGVNKAKDLVRLTVEAGALTAFTEASETVVEPVDPDGRTRIISLSDHRRVAFVDYGPKGGRPVVIFHGYSTGRILPLNFVALLHRAGYRPLAVQRPGFGLSDPAPTQESHLEVQADDLAAVLDALKLRKVDVMIRDGSTAAGLAFAARHGARIARGLLMNPRAPRDVERDHRSLIGAVSRSMLKFPELIVPLGEMLRRQTRTDLLTRTVRRTLESAPGDRTALDDPLVLARVLRDTRGMSARTIAGWAAEMAVYAFGWTLPPVIGGDRWNILFCEGLDWPVHMQLWQEAFPEAPIRKLPLAGFMAYYTHPAEVIAALEG